MSFALQTAHIGAWELDLKTHSAIRALIHDRIFGYERLLPEWTYEMFLEHVVPEDRAEVDRKFRVATETQTDWNFEARIRRADGEERWIWAAGGHEQHGEGKPMRIAGIVQDITERRKAEDALQRNRNMLAQILNSVPQSVFWKDRNSVYLGCNEVLARELGFASPEEIVGKTDFDLPWPGNEAENYIADDKEVMGTKSPKRHILEPAYLDDGTTLWADTTKVPLTDSAGNVYGVLGVFEDITERKRAEEALRESETLLRDAQIIANLGSYVLDITAGLWTTSDGLDKVFGIDQTFERSVEGWASLIHPDDRATMEDYFRNEVLGRSLPFNKEYRIIRRNDQAERWVQGMGKLEFNEQGWPVKMYGTIQDITDRKQMEEKFLRTQRMESLGTLAAGIAHDLNNILTPIMLSADMLHDQMGEKMRVSLAQSIEESARRGADVVNQVLTFARGAKGAVEILQLRNLAEEVEKIICKTFPKNITIINRIEKDLWPVKANSTQIHQALLNLCINARDAMPDGGNLVIAGSNEKIEWSVANRVQDAKPGKYAVIEITDSGMGIPPEIVSRIFDPFFTTKEVGKGSGLGLSTLSGIVRSHGGFVTVQSEVGKGTTFKIFLPVAIGCAEAEKHLESALPPQGTGETVLVVDDEAPIRIATAAVLERNGYKVIAADEGGSAVELFKKNAGKIQLVLTDILMPVMDGVQLAKALKELDPELKIIACTGQASETHQTKLLKLGVNVILNKPYSVRELLDALHHRLHPE